MIPFGLRTWAAASACMALAACSSSEHLCLERSANEGAGNLRFHTSSETFELNGGFARLSAKLKNYRSAQDGAEFGSIYDFDLESKASELMYHAPPPWRLSSKLGPDVTIELVQRLSDGCVTESGEPRPIIETVLRTPTGELLALGAYSVPTLKDGSIPLAAETLQEVQKVEWVDVDCGRSFEDVLDDRRVVGLRLTMKDGTSVLAAPGERKDVRLGTETYIFAPGNAFSSTNGTCAFAGFLLYRQGVIVDAAD